MNKKNLTSSKIRIGINARILQERMSGIPRFTLGLIEGLTASKGKCEIHLFLLKRSFADSAIEEQLSSNPNVFLHFSRWSGDFYFSKALWDLIFVGLESRSHRLDLFIGPSFTIPMVLTCPPVVVVYDITLKRAPLPTGRRLTSLLFRFFQLYVLLPIVMRRAKAVITLSENTRQDLVKEYHIPAEKIYIIPPGVGQKFQQLKDRGRIDEALKRLGIHHSYIVCPSALIPRKNQLMLVEAFAYLQNLQPGNYRLVILGSAEPGYLRQVRKRIAYLGLKNKVLIIPSVSEEDLVALYNGAFLCVYPCIYEGFGLPALEAMACGTPVIVANTSSIPEVVGKAGILVDPFNVNEMAKAIHRVLMDPKLQKNLISKGLNRAKKFSWEKTAEKTLALYRNIKNA